MKSLIVKFIKDESGATMVEYAILVAVIAVAVVVTVAMIRNAINTQFTAVANCISNPASCPGGS